MKYLGVLLAFAAACAGCSNPVMRRSASFCQEHRTREGGPLGFVSNAEKTEGYGLSVQVGGIRGIDRMAVDKFKHTKFEQGWQMGLSGLYLFPGRPARDVDRFVTRHGVELRFEDYSMGLSERDFDYGDLRVKALTLCYRFSALPGKGRGFGFHFDGGLGLGDCAFIKDAEFETDDAFWGIYTRVGTGLATVFEVGGAADFHFEKGFFMSLGYRFAGVYVPVDWDIDGIKRDDIDYFNASNHQFLLTFTYMF